MEGAFFIVLLMMSATWVSSSSKTLDKAQKLARRERRQITEIEQQGTTAKSEVDE
jgi:hypothetical protein